ncbi:hypothetical protein IWX90DRAFT_516610 [Phyllosticta citrichinensis]|uniref:tRNA/rRNA methyltransferase SpoU type domain-containing protein n=1 Tax=Phyllosticta citrichinensis TaxID=1130410 RepID=A0ABR1XJT6_9PEZI
MAASPPAPLERGAAHLLLLRLPPHERLEALADLVAELYGRALHGHLDFATARLAAELLQQCPEHGDATRARSLFLQLLLETIRLSDSHQQTIDICARDPLLANQLVSSIGRDLARSALAFYHRDQLAVPPSSIASKQALDDVPLEDRRLIKYLDFFKYYFLSENPCHLTINLLLALLVFLGASSQEISDASRDVLSAAFYSIRTAQVSLDISDDNLDVFGAVEGAVGPVIWSRIEDLLSSSDSRFFLSAFHVWFRWFSLGGDLGPSVKILGQDDYWAFLQRGLVEGFSEQRKYCLFILRASVGFAQDQQQDVHQYVSGAKTPTFETDYTRYCTLFETIILGRYLNQVEACLPDLRALAWGSQVHPTWIITLLSASLSTSVQDGIRKMIGNQILDQLVPLPTSATPVFEDFVILSLLPWATQGWLFTGSMSRDREDVRCRHGELLSAYIRRLLQSCKDEACCQKYARGILSFLHEKGKRLFQHAHSYCLQGILDGMTQRTRLQTQDISLLVQVAMQTGLPEVVRDFATAAASVMINESARNEPAILVTIPGYKLLKGRWDDLQKRRNSDLITSPSSNQGAGPDTDTTVVESIGAFEVPPGSQPSLKAFLQILQETKHKCLHDSGLIDACNYIRKVILSGTEIDPQDLHLALEDIWDEMERQEYPRTALMQLPELFYHPKILQVASEETQTLLSGALSDFFAFSESRIFVLTPLARAVRRAYFKVPEACSWLPVEDFVVRFASKPPSPRMELLLEAAVAGKLSALVPHCTYEYYYGPTEARAYAYVFDMLNRLRDSDRPMAMRIVERLMHPWVHQKLPIPMVSKWKESTQLQTLILLQGRAFSNLSDEDLSEKLETFFKILAIEPLPRYRFLLEWIISTIYVTRRSLRHRLLEILDTEDHTNPKFLASVMKLAIIVARLWDSDEEFALKLMTILVPYAASHKIVIRHESQWSFLPLWDHAAAKGWTKLVENPVFAALNRHIRSLDKYSTPPPDRTLEWFDPVGDCNLFTLFQGKYFDLEPAEPRTVSMDDFRAVFHEDTKGPDCKYLTPRLTMGDQKLAMGVSAPSSDVSTSTAINLTLDVASRPPPAPAAPAASTNFLQTKGQAWQNALLAPPSLSSSPSSTDNITPNTAARPTPVILIGSLIDNPYNLGGLSRLAEIFGCAALHLRTLATLSHKDFTSVAVSSQSHVPITATPPAALSGFLRAQKAAGYAVVGVEQTDRSVVLGRDGAATRRVLRRRCVLVMGSEREGGCYEEFECADGGGGCAV